MFYGDNQILTEANIGLMFKKGIDWIVKTIRDIIKRIKEKISKTKEVKNRKYEYKHDEDEAVKMMKVITYKKFDNREASKHFFFTGASLDDISERAIGGFNRKKMNEYVANEIKTVDAIKDMVLEVFIKNKPFKSEEELFSWYKSKLSKSKDHKGNLLEVSLGGLNDTIDKYDKCIKHLEYYEKMVREYSTKIENVSKEYTEETDIKGIRLSHEYEMYTYKLSIKLITMYIASLDSQVKYYENLLKENGVSVNESTFNSFENIELI